MTSSPLRTDFQPLPLPPCRLGESPMWHPQEQVLYWVDIAGREVHRFDPGSGRHDAWPQPSEPAVVLPVLDGGVMVAMRDGLWRLDARGGRRPVAAAPYDPRQQRFNDGKADAAGRIWLGTIDDARQPRAQLWRRSPEVLGQDGSAGFVAMTGGLANANGLAFSRDGATLYWADTRGHQLLAFDCDPDTGGLSRRRVWKRFAERTPAAEAAGGPTAASADAPADAPAYGGRPDGAAVDSEGAYWVAMYEGQRLLRLRPDDGAVLAELHLPVRCPTMPCFGGPDGCTLYVTSAREGRPAAELAAQPWAGCVLQARVSVPGLPAHLVDGG